MRVRYIVLCGSAPARSGKMHKSCAYADDGCRDNCAWVSATARFSHPMPSTAPQGNAARRTQSIVISAPYSHVNTNVRTPRRPRCALMMSVLAFPGQTKGTVMQNCADCARVGDSNYGSCSNCTSHRRGARVCDVDDGVNASLNKPHYRMCV